MQAVKSISTLSGRPSALFGHQTVWKADQTVRKAGPSTLFGRPSALFGRPSTLFGRPSALFGRPSTLFGRPSTLLSVIIFFDCAGKMNIFKIEPIALLVGTMYVLLVSCDIGMLSQDFSSNCFV